MHGWYSDADFTDRRGAPRLLARRGTRSLEELFRRYSGDIPPKALLDVLTEGAFARRLPNGMYEPLSREFSCENSAAVNAADLATDIDIFFDAILGGGHTAQIRRIDATFSSADVPASIVRICNERADRFLSAMSHYLHASSLKERPKDRYDTSTFSFVILNAKRHGTELDNRRDFTNAESTSA